MKSGGKILKNKVKAILHNRMLGWKSSEEDAQIICDVINVLANRSITINHATSILEDTLKIIPMIKSL